MIVAMIAKRSYKTLAVFLNSFHIDFVMMILKVFEFNNFISDSIGFIGWKVSSTENQKLIQITIRFTFWKIAIAISDTILIRTHFMGILLMCQLVWLNGNSDIGDNAMLAIL